MNEISKRKARQRVSGLKKSQVISPATSQLLKKPLLRGMLHQEAFFIAIGACALLIARSSSQATFVATIVYSLGLLLLFGFSAVYHRIQWGPEARSILKRIDHSAIFVLIAATTTPIALFTLPALTSEKLLWTVWIAALIGIAQSIFWISAPKWVTALLCICVGWLSLPCFQQITHSMTQMESLFLLAGGVVYTIGALFYAFKKPNFFPGIFGYHELFHLFTIIAAGLHFVVVYDLVARA